MVVFFDANVLVPLYLRNLILRLARRRGLFEVRWSPEVLDDVEKALIEDIELSTEKAKRAVDVLRARWGSLVTGFEYLIPSMTNDIGDRSVLAAAVHCGADRLVTNNLRHFKDEDTLPHGIRAVNSGDFLVSLWERAEDEVSDVLSAETREYNNPTMKLPDLLQAYARAGAIEFSELVSEQVLGTKFIPRP